MPKRRGIQRSYEISRSGISARYTSRAHRQRRIRELVETMDKELRMWAGRVRAHEVRMRDYGLEKLILSDLVNLNEHAV